MLQYTVHSTQYINVKSVLNHHILIPSYSKIKIHEAKGMIKS